MIDQFRRVRSSAGFAVGLLLLIGLFVGLGNSGGSSAVSASGLAASPPDRWSIGAYRIITETGTVLYLPVVARPGAQPTATLPPEPTRQWDPRLDQRGAELRPAVVTPGQGYWRLIKARWYNEQEAQNRVNIFVDTINPENERVVDVPIRFYWAAGEFITLTQKKAGEEYAADYPMQSIAPAYGAKPNDGNPGDEVWGMGLGSIEQPFHSIHTSYGLTWQWAIAGGAVNTSTATPTMSPTPTSTPTPTPPDGATTTPTPTASPSATPTATPTPAIDWDPRLTQRGASLQEATVAPGQGYWKLVRARWYNEQESGNRQHILVDALDESGQRVAGLPVRIYWEGGQAGITTEAKPGEEYATNYVLAFPAPFYNAAPNNGSPADAVLGMGLGSLENPSGLTRASYGLTWRWTIKSAPPATPTPTPTATPGETTPATPTLTPTSSATPASYLFNRAELVKCEPNAGVTYVEGTLRLGGQPANGHRVAFSFEADGPVVAETISGPHAGYEGWNPGFYSHLLQPNGAREGDWWFWVMDGAGQRVSALGFVHTHGTAGDGQCQQAVIDFHSE